MIIQKKIVIQKPIAEVWNVLGNGFGDAHRWATVVSHAELFGSGKNGASCDYRVCSIKGLGQTKENVLRYSEKEHVLSYQIEAAGFPKMVKYSSNTWRLKELGPSEVEVSMEIEMQVAGFLGALMQPMMRMQMGGMASGTLNDFKHFVETGKPSAKKLKALSK